jgi:hypothetical protein
MRRDVSGHVWPNAGLEELAYAAAASSSCSCAFTFGRMKRRRIYMIIRCAPCGAGPRRTRLRGIKKYFLSYFLNKNQVGLKGKKKDHTHTSKTLLHTQELFFIFIFGLNPAGKLAAAGCRLSVRMISLSFFIQLVNYKVWCVCIIMTSCVGRKEKKKILGFYFFFGCP